MEKNAESGNKIEVYKNLVITSGINPEVDVTEVYALAEKSRAIVDIDINDDEKMKEVATVRKELVSYRRGIERDIKVAGADLKKKYKALNEIGNSVIDILSSEEERLKSSEKEKKEQDIKKAREESLPQRKAMLDTITDGVVLTDDEILRMDDSEFLTHVSERQIAFAEVQKVKDAEKEAETKRKEDEEVRIKQAEAQAKLDAENKAKDEISKVKADADAQVAAVEAKVKADAQAKIDADVKVKEDAEAKVKADAEAQSKLESEENYQAWLKANNFNPETDKIKDTGLSVIMYREVATFVREI